MKKYLIILFAIGGFISVCNANNLTKEQQVKAYAKRVTQAVPILIPHFRAGGKWNCVEVRRALV